MGGEADPLGRLDQRRTRRGSRARPCRAGRSGRERMSETHQLEISEVLVDEVSQHPDNANNGDLEALKESIQVNGFFSPIIVQASTGYIIAGNHRWQVANELGMVTIPAIILDV